LVDVDFQKERELNPPSKL